MKAAMPPAFWAWATTCNASVVLPLDSGPKISTIRPLGMPCPPRARSSDRLPVGIPSIWRGTLAAQGHDGPFAELLLDLRQRVLQIGIARRTDWRAAGFFGLLFPALAGVVSFGM